MSAISGTGSIVLPIPDLPGLIGVTFSCQSLAFSPDTALNLISSNGTVFSIGY